MSPEPAQPRPPAGPDRPPAPGWPVPAQPGRPGARLTVRADGVVVIDDAYTTDPDSVRAALKELAALARSRPGARAWAVLGPVLEPGGAEPAAGPDGTRADEESDGTRADEKLDGARADEEHDALGRLAVRLRIDRLVVVGQAAARIHAGAALEGSWGEESVMVTDSEAALALLAGQLRPGDVVLVKGRRADGLGRVARALAATAPEDDR